MQKLPSIPTLPARMAKLVPLEGLGCEAAVGSLTPSREREYKVTNKHTEGRCPVYAIVFNFLDVRYYDIFATACGPRVRFLTRRHIDLTREVVALHVSINRSKSSIYLIILFALDVFNLTLCHVPFFMFLNLPILKIHIRVHSPKIA